MGFTREARARTPPRSGMEKLWQRKRPRTALKAEAVKEAVPAAKGTVGNLVFKQLKNDSGVVLKPGKR